MGLWVELGIFGLALAFGLWQLHDVKKAREETQRRKALERDRQRADQARLGGADGPADPPA